MLSNNRGLKQKIWQMKESFLYAGIAQCKRRKSGKLMRKWDIY